MSNGSSGDMAADSRHRGACGPPRPFLGTAVLLAVACAGPIACGRKAAPRAPEDVVPKTITNLRAVNTTEGILLSWSRPRVYADGTRMPDLGGFEIRRASGSDPHATFGRIAVIEVTDRDRFRPVTRFRHLDPTTSVGVEYRYQVVSYTVDRYFSAPSNVVTIERQLPNEETHAPLPTPQR